MITLGADTTATATFSLASTSTALASNLNPSTSGQFVTFTATVTSAGGTPTGTVTFLDGGTVLCASVGLGSGSATCTTAALATGTHNITASYSGDSVYAPSASGILVQTVNACTMADSDGDSIPDCVEIAEARNPAFKDNDIFASARLFAMQQYRDFLNREGDAGGISFWTNQVQTGALTRGQCIESFFSSVEFQGTVSPVVRLYFAYFLRVPDYGGLQFWIDYRKSGNSLDSVSNNFAASLEFQGRYGALSNSAFVTLVYRNVLGRDPDAGGLAFWTQQLDTGARTRGQVMLAFSESPEFRSISFIDVYVTMMYVGMLRRSPDDGGFNFWTGYMENGNSGLALIDSFLASTEYHNRFLP